MKKAIITIILCPFLLIANISIASTGIDTISSAERKVSEARLLEQYIIRYIIRLRDTENQFPSIEKTYIENTLQNIEGILIELNNIQKWYYTLIQSEAILQNTIQYMRLLNEDLNTKINSIQERKNREVERWKDRYFDTIQNIYNLTWRIIEINSRYYLHLNRLSAQDREAIEIIIELRKTNEELIRYRERRYNNLSELQSYLRWKIESLREDISALRKLTRS